MLGSMNMAMQQMKTNSYPHPGAFRVGLSVPVGGFAISVKRGIIAFGYRAQQQTPMTERRNANLFEVLIGQIRQDEKANIVLGKPLRVLSESELVEPVHDLLHCGAPSDSPSGEHIRATPSACVSLLTFRLLVQSGLVLGQ
jgi:hypothetical protein